MLDFSLEKAKEIAKRLALARNPIDWSEMDFPDVSCKKCGIEIYCGVNSLCKDQDCPKKYTST